MLVTSSPFLPTQTAGNAHQESAERSPQQRLSVSVTASSTQLVQQSLSDGNSTSHVTLFQHQQSQVSAVYEKPVVAAVGPVAEPSEEVNPYAGNILSFISAQLYSDQSEDASLEDMQSRLEAGLAGFLQGYGEAADQLTDSGLLSPAIEAEITETYNQVLKGIAALAEELGLENPVADDLYKPTVEAENTAVSAPVAAPVASVNNNPVADMRANVLSNIFAETSETRILDSVRQMRETADTYTEMGKNLKAKFAQSATAAVAESKDFSFELKTRDGDTVTINASAMRAGASAFAQGSNGVGVATVGQQSSAFDFQVDGELDVDELKAINDLLSQVTNISDRFFAGDIESAFEKALAVGFDTDEISGFQLNLSMVTVETLTEQTQGPMNTTDTQGIYSVDQSKGQLLQRFVDELNDAGRLAESFGQNKSLVVELLETMAATRHADKPNAEHLAPFAEKVLNA